MRTAGRFLRHLEEIVSGSLLVLLCVTVALQVFSRFVLRDPYIWAEELARLFFIWTAFIGAAVALKHHRHFAIELLAARLSLRGGRLARSALWCRRFAVFLVIVLLGILVWYGFAHTWSVRGTRTDILEISVAWTYLPLPLSCLAMLIRSLPMLVSPPMGSAVVVEVEPEGRT
jgi:TRAP-type transport system small permease protein